MTNPKLECQRQHFSLPDDEHYLNCAYMGPLPKSAEEAGRQGLAMKRNPATLSPRDFFDRSNQVRAQFARLMEVTDSQRIAIVPAVSYAVASAARNLAPTRGSRIVILEAQFPGNVYAWRRLAHQFGASLHTVPRPPGAVVGRQWNERVIDGIGPDTAVVAMPVVHWTDGTRFELEAIADRCREVGAALVVDATQSAGAVPFSVARVQPDLLVCACYKWLLGPYSVALAYFGPRFDDGVPLEETWIGRAGSENFQGLVHYVDEYQPGAIRYDVGERSNLALLPVVAAALELIEQWRPARISEYVASLTRPFMARAEALGFGVEHPDWRSNHLLGLKMPPSLELDVVQKALNAARVHVSLRGTSLRISPYVYNTGDDLAALEHALRKALS